MNPSSPAPQVNPLFYVQGGPTLISWGHWLNLILLAFIAIFFFTILGMHHRAGTRVRNLENEWKPPHRRLPS